MNILINDKMMIKCLNVYVLKGCRFFYGISFKQDMFEICSPKSKLLFLLLLLTFVVVTSRGLMAQKHQGKKPWLV